MSIQDVEKLEDRLYQVFRNADFLNARGLANEIPIFIQCYSPQQEDALRRIVEDLTRRLKESGTAVQTFDLFDLVMKELEDAEIAEDLLQYEQTYDSADMLETLKNYSDPAALTERITNEIAPETELTLITGSGRVFPFLRTHAILEGLQPKMENQRPIVFFFPGQYCKDPETGPQLRLFGGEAQTATSDFSQPYYRAINLDDYHLSGT